MVMSPEVTGVIMALGAGLCTTIGGACVFFVSNFQRLPLAVCMAVSSGVMVYVSFVEIFTESVQSLNTGLNQRWSTLEEDKLTKGYASLFATVCFFAGWLLATLMDCMIELLIHKCNLEGTAKVPEETAEITDDVVGVELGTFSGPPEREPEAEHASKSSGETAGNSTSTEPVTPDPSEGLQDNKLEKAPSSWLCRGLRCVCAQAEMNESRALLIAHAEDCFHRDTERFLRMGVFTALALTLHNLPEGVATFTSVKSSNTLGASVAVAIGIHNIPEGFAVSVPLYFGTGRKWRSFFYSVITGLAEPLGALLAWAALGDTVDDLVLGAAFGVVSGIMVNIALKEMLPSAFRYDPCDEVTTKCFVCGMLVMAFSLVVFEFTSG